jgi:hypothetical protein
MSGHNVIEGSSSTTGYMMEIASTLDSLGVMSIETHSLSKVSHRLDCTGAADMSTGVLEILSIK